jgi:sugar phosphate isomerase/epimerase
MRIQMNSDPMKISRRDFTRSSLIFTAGAFINPQSGLGQISDNIYRIKLGAPILSSFDSPGQWIKELKKRGYAAAYCPVDENSDTPEREAYKKAARKSGMIISEVGTWSNPISPDEEERRKAFEKCIAGLQLADEMEAACCVNTSGSRNPEHWAGPHMDNLSDETFDMIVESTRKIIDSVKPTRTWFTLKPMPWAFPYSADSYQRLIDAIDRERFAVHFDPVNLVTSPEIYFNNGEMIRDFFRKLGTRIKSCHAKDIILREDIYTTQLSELAPGKGKLDYAVFLKELSRLKDVPLMIEHLDTDEEYIKAAFHIRSVARKNNIPV